MPTFVMTKGLPASGKSTWAEQVILERPAGAAVRVNRDLIRTMLHADRWKGSDTEDLTVAARDVLLEIAMQNRVDVVITDDTNLDPKLEEHFHRLAERYLYDFQVKDFTSVPVKTCIERDLKRSRSVGEKVIKRMYAKYLEQPYEAIEGTPGLPWAILVDVDGTLAHMQGRSPYDYTKVATDLLDEVVAELVASAADAGYTIIVCSGRDDSCRDDTADWLNRHKIHFDQLLMRKTGDDRKDSIVKSEIFDQQIAGKYNIRYVLDDRDQVVEMWRERGLKVLQVAPGDF